jgi:hypothetical protein
VRFVFADFIDEPIEQGNQSFIFGFGVGDEDGVSQRRPRVYRFAHVEILHGSLLPPAFVVFGMGKHGTDVDLFSIVANRSDQSNLISSNIKHCELPTRSAVGKTARSSAKFKKLPFFIVAYQRARADWVSGNLSANSFRRFRVMTCIKDGQPERSTREQSQHERENYSKHSVCSSGFSRRRRVAAHHQESGWGSRVKEPLSKSWST